MPPSEHELRLRERLGRLRNLPLVGGARLSGELERLQRQIERIGEEAIGEGGSGGAIAIALADRVLMQENAIYSVISPEGCAAILWRDAGQAKKAAAAFRPDAIHCLELGVVDQIVSEPVGGAHIDHDLAARMLGQALRESLEELEGIPGEDLRRRRRARFRALGVFA